MESTGSFEYSRNVVRELRMMSFALIGEMDGGTGKGLRMKRIMDCMNIEQQPREQPT